MRSTLIAALAECSKSPRKPKARRFLQGLSSDELLFIAEYLGSCILESRGSYDCSRGELAQRIAEFQCSRTGLVPSRADGEHKMILLLEYLWTSGFRPEQSRVRS